MELGLKGMEISWALQHALWENKSIHFDRSGKRIEDPQAKI